MELRKKENRPRFIKRELWTKVVTSRKKKPSQDPEKAKKYIKELEKWKKNEESSWEIEEILDKRPTPTGGVEVLIKWDGWPSKFNTWEPIENLNDSLLNVLEKLKKQKEEKINRERKCPGRQKRSRKNQRSDSPEWGEIEEVIDQKIRYGHTYYLIKWKDCPEENNSWEREENLLGVDLEMLKKRFQTESADGLVIKIPISLLRKPNDSPCTQRSNQKQRQQLRKAKAPPLIEDIEPLEQNTNMTYSKELVSDSRHNSQVIGKMTEQQTYFIKKSSRSEEVFNKQSDLSQVFSPESIFFNSIGPEDKKTYNHRIITHRCCKNGYLEAFHVMANNKFDSLVLPISFWCDLAEARINYPEEVMEYLMKTSLMDMVSAPLYE